MNLWLLLREIDPSLSEPSLSLSGNCRAKLSKDFKNFQKRRSLPSPRRKFGREICSYLLESGASGNGGFALVYSLIYLQEQVEDIGLRAPLDRLCGCHDQLPARTRLLVWSGGCFPPTGRRRAGIGE